ncbi:MAG: hypothetical protein M9962_10355 [Oligoflexia bacterium]|nr:hypothetical protein [Oligoflexia bacterium]
MNSRKTNENAAKNIGGKVNGLLKYMLEQDRSDQLTELRRFNSVMEKIRGAKLCIDGIEYLASKI